MGIEGSVVEKRCHFPCGCLCAKGAELESRLVPRMAVHEQQKMSVISGDQLSPYQIHVHAADQDHGLCFSNHLMLT